jgi:hypothetical protein
LTHKILQLFRLLFLVTVTFVTHSAEAQSSLPGPYYPTPSWDQKISCGSGNHCPRFIVLSDWNNEAVLDRETGLVWEQSPSSDTFVWQLGAQQNASFHCLTEVVGNRLGWRLPTVQELASLVDPTNNSPALPTGHPFSNVQSSGVYWSATTALTDADGAWTVNFGNGDLTQFIKTASNYVWCVRGGQANLSPE